MTARVLSWDWRQQPDLGQLGATIRELSGGQVHLHQVDTGSDGYVIVLTDENLTAGEVASVYKRVADLDEEIP